METTSLNKWQRWRPAGYTVAAVLTAIGGALNGLDTGSIGAITVMSSFADTFGDLTPVMRGFTVSLIMLTGAVPSFFAGQIADRYGRLPTIGAGAIVFLVGVVLQASSSQMSQFLVGRALAGLGEGIRMSNATVYIAEIAPRAKRGVYVAMPCFGASLGIVIGYFVCFGTVKIASSAAWRLPYLIQGTLAIILVISCVFLPSSPRWLVLHGQEAKALEAVARLGLHREEVEKDILAARVSEQQDSESSALSSLFIMFKRQYRSQTLLGLFIHGMVQLSGIDGILYYAPILFQQAGLPAASAGFLASGVSAVLMLAIAIPALLFADCWGRRTSVLLGGVLLSGSMFLIGALYASDSVHSHGIARWVVVVSIFVFAISYNGTWGIVAKIYASEIQPARTRAAATCVAQGLGFFTNWIVAFITPIFLAKSSYGPYFLYGALSFATMLILAFYMPETRGRSLEDIQVAFEIPSILDTLRRLGSLINCKISNACSASKVVHNSSLEVSCYASSSKLEKSPIESTAMGSEPVLTLD